jgi:hypothetical protein
MERLRRLAATSAAPPPNSRSTFSASLPQSSPPCHSSARFFGASVALANAPADAGCPVAGHRSQHRQLTVEPLWSLAVATRGNRWQTARPLKRPRQAKTVAVGCQRLPPRFHGKGAPRKGGGRLPRCAKSAKSCEPEGPQDLTPRLLHEVDFASTARGVRRLDTLRRALRRRASPEAATRASGRRPRPPARRRAPPPRPRARG